MSDQNNPYSAPNANVADVFEEMRLADRGMRFVGALIDGIILLAILVPLMFVGGYFTMVMSGQQPGFGTQIGWGVVGIVVFIVVQGYPLKATGQTWGKKLLKMKIVDLDGKQPEFTRLLALRYLSTQVISLIPVAGGIYSLVNVLFIFGEDRRCLHDKIASTRVVMAD